MVLRVLAAIVLNSGWRKQARVVKLSDYDYDLPSDRIAQNPLPVRDQSRLMVLDRATRRIAHAHFRDLPDYLRTGDCLVLNETRVLPARLVGRKADTGGSTELLLLRRVGDTNQWSALVKPGRRVRKGSRLVFGEGRLTAEVLGRTDSGARIVGLACQGDLGECIHQLGQIPLPPYIKRPPSEADKSAYQTVYAAREGAVAAPTAGLHFTADLLERLTAGGIRTARVLLHVGAGTFRPVVCEDPTQHPMEAEYYEVSAQAARIINHARAEGGRVVAVGTTSARTLETVAVGEAGLRCGVAAGSGWTDLFIYPPYQWKAVDALITNFHLPRSTLLMLVAAFAGRSFVLRAYEAAVRERYRFYSYGDAMLIC